MTQTASPRRQRLSIDSPVVIVVVVVAVVVVIVAVVVVIVVVVGVVVVVVGVVGVVAMINYYYASNEATVLLSEVETCDMATVEQLRRLETLYEDYNNVQATSSYHITQTTTTRANGINTQGRY